MDSALSNVDRGTTLDRDTLLRWIGDSAAEMRRNRDYLVQLDAAIGDGDHGTNMNRGFEAVTRAVSADQGSSPGHLLVLVGRTLVGAVGGASGPLWGSAFRQMGKSLGRLCDLRRPGPGHSSRRRPGGNRRPGSGRAGGQDHGRCLRSRARRDSALPSKAASRCPPRCARRPRRPRRGCAPPCRCRRAGGERPTWDERSIGHQDPGATSTAMIIGLWNAGRRGRADSSDRCHRRARDNRPVVHITDESSSMANERRTTIQSIDRAAAILKALGSGPLRLRGERAGRSSRPRPADSSRSAPDPGAARLSWSRTRAARSTSSAPGCFSSATRTSTSTSCAAVRSSTLTGWPRGPAWRSGLGSCTGASVVIVHHVFRPDETLQILEVGSAASDSRQRSGQGYAGPPRARCCRGLVPDGPAQADQAHPERSPAPPGAEDRSASRAWPPSATRRFSASPAWAPQSSIAPGPRWAPSAWWGDRARVPQGPGARPASGGDRGGARRVARARRGSLAGHGALMAATDRRETSAGRLGPIVAPDLLTAGGNRCSVRTEVGSALSNEDRLGGERGCSIQQTSEAVAEMFGTAALVFIGAGSVTATHHADWGTKVVLRRRRSAGHLLRLLLRNHRHGLRNRQGVGLPHQPGSDLRPGGHQAIPWSEVPLYWGSQVVGGIVGALGIFLLFGNDPATRRHVARVVTQHRSGEHRGRLRWPSFWAPAC